MREAVPSLWRQYRFERRMFWRNPSAAFFNFLLPLIFLAAFGAIVQWQPSRARSSSPAIAGMSVMSTTFTALAYNMTFLREQGVLKRMRGTPLPSGVYLGGLALNAVTNAAMQIAIVSLGGRVFFGLGWPPDWSSWSSSCSPASSASRRSASRSRTRSPTSTRPPAFVNAVFVPVVILSSSVFRREQRAELPARHRRRRCRSKS